VRNLAIPKTARNQKNPIEPTPEATQEGREYFLDQCASCHGIDGSGRTQVGLNLYPRVPDLRAAGTQSLNDGAIHYIIENGVQLTGMPAWGNPHGEPSSKGWKLVLFIRTLHPLSHQEISQQATTAVSARYVGSQACEKCHAEIYQRWEKTPMANVIRDPRSHPNAIIPDLASNNVARFTQDQVAFVYGGLWKQRYFTKVGDDYFPIPVQWDVGTHQWLPYMVPAKGGGLVGIALPSEQHAAAYRPNLRWLPFGGLQHSH